MYPQAFCERLRMLFALKITRPAALGQALNDWPQLAFDSFAAQHAFCRKVVEIGVQLYSRQRLVLLLGYLTFPEFVRCDWFETCRVGIFVRRKDGQQHFSTRPLLRLPPLCFVRD